MKYTLAVDFDGVLHSATSQWVNATTVPDPPVPGALEWLVKMQKTFDVVIFSCRASFLNGRGAIVEWLAKHGVDFPIDNVTDVKPPALLYVDDRGWRFTGDNFPTAQEVFRAHPWNRNK